MDFPIRRQSGTEKLIGYVVGSSAPAGLSGAGAQLGRGKGRGKATTSDYACPHPHIFALVSQRVTEPPAGNTSDGLNLLLHSREIVR
ncbi:hypothetical protein HAX54_006313 [Datura stramonium]|uniref:Uncharacterized protein n=1 Tax=Datura stramonium TaxID=4076 RepID=A0ABS8WYV0_DATST|nr:hypothetical protein [Datura stramonium]